MYDEYGFRLPEPEPPMTVFGCALIFALVVVAAVVASLLR